MSAPGLNKRNNFIHNELYNKTPEEIVKWDEDNLKIRNVNMRDGIIIAIILILIIVLSIELKTKNKKGYWALILPVFVLFIFCKPKPKKWDNMTTLERQYDINRRK